MKVAFYTLGCKVNQYETNGMIQAFLEKGYKIVDFTEKSDIYIINTCTVTSISDKKSRQMIRRTKQLNPEAIVVAVGCYAQVAKDKLEEIKDIDLILGISEKTEIIKYVEEEIKERNPKTYISDVMHQKQFVDFGSVNYTDKNRVAIKVQDGCNQFCTYCIIPYARGRIRSRKIENVKKEVEDLAQKGIKEIVITGIHVASYGKDLEENIGLIDLLEEINKIDGIERIRLGSIEPLLITDEFAERLLAKICDHFHLSLQSGCNETLKRMNRHYTTEDFKKATELLRKTYPNVALTTDIIVGFPGETDEEFEDTLDVVQKVKFEQVYMFIYSRRVGTPGDRMENQVPEEIKHIRFNKLKDLVESQIEENNKKYIGTIQKILVEGTSKNNEEMLTGRTDSNKVVIFEGNKELINQIINIKIISEHMWYLKGEIL